MRYIFLYLTLFASLPAVAQYDTTYFTQYWEETTKENATYFRAPVTMSGELYKVRDYYINGQLKMEAYFSSFAPEMKEGYTAYYHENGTKSSEGYYVKDKPVGIWTHRYKDVDQIHCEINYTKRKDTSETLTSFYKSGKLKRKQWTVKNKTRGVCYTEEGKEKRFTPFNSFPEPKYSVERFLEKNIEYPVVARRAWIQGRVLIRFIVRENGEIAHASIYQSAHPLLDSEALRVVKSMPRWKPGMADDEPVKVYFTLPIMFELPW